MNVQEIGHCHIFTVIEGDHVGSGEIEVDATPVNPYTFRERCGVFSFNFLPVFRLLFCKCQSCSQGGENRNCIRLCTCTNRTILASYFER